MKYLFVESSITGHRIIYHKTLIEAVGVEKSILITPEIEPAIGCKQIINSYINLQPRTLQDYNKWIDYILEISKTNNIEIIHILDGDLLYRFWGIGLKKLAEYKIIVTYHHIKNDFAHRISVGRIAKNIEYCVVHTRRLKERFSGIPNLKLIHYPHFQDGNMLPRTDARKFYNIEDNAKVYLLLGGTRYEKGADIFMKSLKYVRHKGIVVLIAGKENTFSEEYLRKLNTSGIKVIYRMGYLSPDEWNMALIASDYVVLPYRKKFTGASGPLTEAVWFQKIIIGPNVESIGDIIKTYKLGYTYKAENEKALAIAIDYAYEKGLQIGDRYKEYVKEISSQKFVQAYQQIYG